MVVLAFGAGVAILAAIECAKARREERLEAERERAAERAALQAETLAPEPVKSTS